VAASAKIQAMMDESMRDNAKSIHGDQELLGRVAAADPAAFQELYQRHVDQLIGFAVRRLSSPEEVADLVSAVFLEVYAHVDKLVDRALLTVDQLELTAPLPAPVVELAPRAG
jgi:Sigma-70 region 2